MKRMINKITFTLYFLHVCFLGIGQGSIRCELSTVQAGRGEVIEIRYEANDLDVKFSAPEIPNLPIVSGPNISTSMSYINGLSHRKIVYAYQFRAEGKEFMVLPPAHFLASDTTYTIPEIPIEIFDPEHVPARESQGFVEVYSTQIGDGVARKNTPSKTTSKRKKKRL